MKFPRAFNFRKFRELTEFAKIKCRENLIPRNHEAGDQAMSIILQYYYCSLLNYRIVYWLRPITREILVNYCLLRNVSRAPNTRFHGGFQEKILTQKMTGVTDGRLG